MTELKQKSTPQGRHLTFRPNPDSIFRLALVFASTFVRFWPSSLLKNYGYCCFIQNRAPTRRDEGDCYSRSERLFWEPDWQDLGSPYPSWIFDRGTTKSPPGFR